MYAGHNSWPNTHNHRLSLHLMSSFVIWSLVGIMEHCSLWTPPPLPQPPRSYPLHPPLPDQHNREFVNEYNVSDMLTKYRDGPCLCLAIYYRISMSFLLLLLICPLTVRVVGAPQMISQPVSSIFPCSSLPSRTWRTPGLSISWCCLPTSSSVCLVLFPLSLCLARWFLPDLMVLPGYIDRMTVWTCHMYTWPTQQKEQRKLSDPKQQASNPNQADPRLQTDPKAQNPGEILWCVLLVCGIQAVSLEGIGEYCFG